MAILMLFLYLNVLKNDLESSFKIRSMSWIFPFLIVSKMIVKEFFFFKGIKGLPWQSSGWDSVLPMQECGFEPWLGN